jgi:hypothetical protein
MLLNSKCISYQQDLHGWLGKCKAYVTDYYGLKQPGNT